MNNLLKKNPYAIADFFLFLALMGVCMALCGLHMRVGDLEDKIELLNKHEP